MANFDKNTFIHPHTVIKVVGVGNAGCNSVANVMTCDKIKDVEFIMSRQMDSSLNMIMHLVKLI